MADDKEDVLSLIKDKEKFEKDKEIVLTTIKKHFPISWFQANQIKKIANKLIGQNVSIFKILSKLTEEGTLDCSRSIGASNFKLKA